MSGIDEDARIDWKAAELLDRLMSDRGWNPRDVERASKKTGNPQRVASYSTIYRVLRTGHKPSRPSRREIAAAFGLRPSEIWQGGADHDPAPYPMPVSVTAGRVPVAA